MELNRERIRMLMNDKFEGNYNKFAYGLGLDPSHIHRYLTKGVGGGKKILGAILKYCKENGLKMEDYVDLK